ncbi:hypothetical protein CORI_1177 [Campylobacter sp. CCUG 57310]|nr:hypothetical protein CORI_1177 [Campylobacter sp. CCUG 57310]
MINKTNNKGFNMALPFIAGVVAGGLVVAAFNNRKKVKSALECGLEKGKNVANEVKEFTTEKFEKISKDIKKEVKKGRKKAEAKVEKTEEKAPAAKKKRAPRAKKPAAPKVDTTPAAGAE